MNQVTRLEATSAATSMPYRIGHQSVWHGDCLEYMRSMPCESIDVVVTSPPYNIGVRYGLYDDRQPQSTYIEWLTQVGCQISRVLRPSGSLFLNVGSTNVNPWIAMDVANAFRSIFELQNTIVWVKSLAVGDDTFGHFKPITSRRFLNNNHEWIFHFTKNGETNVDRLAIGVPFKDKSNISRWGHKRDRRCAGNVWFIPYRTVRSKAEKFNHPAGFPVELPKRCIQLHGKSNAVVLDPFLGAGTTLIATTELGCRGIGLEIDSHYVDTTIRRLQGHSLP